MIVTDTTLSGYTVINGSWGLQFGLLVGSMYNYFTYPSNEVYGYLEHDKIVYWVEFTRVLIMCIHGVLIMVNILMHSTRLNAPILKYVFSFAGMLLYVYLVISVAYVNYYTPTPDASPNIATGAVVTWFRVEMCIWFGILCSNITFMFLRSIFKHKVDHSIYLDDNKKLPSIDTMLALHLAGTSFHTEFVPAFVSTFLYYNKSGQQAIAQHIMEVSLKCVLVSAWMGAVSVSILTFVSW